MSSDDEKKKSEPGFFRMLGSVIKRPFYENAAKEEQARMETASLRASTMALEETVRAMRPEDEGLMPVLGGKARDPGPAETRTLREQAQQAAYRQPLLKGYLRTLKRFVMGEGATVVVEGVEDDDLKERIEDWLKDFRRINRWDVLEDEIPARSWRDGESFIRRFTNDRPGPRPANLGQQQRQRLRAMGTSAEEIQAEPIPRGMTILRMVDPDQIRDPEGVFEEGVVTDKDDAQTVYGYVWAPEAMDVTEAEFVPASRMEHVKLEVDSDVLRGRSILESLLKKNKQYEDWLQARIMLSIARSSIFMFKQIQGTQAQGQAIRDQEEKQLDSANSQRTRMPKPLSTVHHGPGINYEFKAPDVQAQDARYDGRAILLNMSADTGLPEYMFTGDSANANYASHLVSEGPAFREFESWQDFFTEPFLRIHRWALIDAAQYGAVKGLTPELAEDVELRIQFGNIEVRDEKPHTEANEIRHRNRLLSRQGWAEDDGIDWEIEKDRVEQERQEDVEFTAPPPDVLDDGDDDEGEED